MMKRLLAALLCLMLCVPAALGETEFLPQLTAWDLENASEPIRATVNVDLDTWMPFDENTLAALKLLISHVTLQTEMLNVDGEAWSRTAVLLDGGEALSLTRRDLDGESQLNASFSPDTVYVTKKSDPMAMLLGGSTAVSFGGITGGEGAWMADGRAIVFQLHELMGDYAKEKKISKKFDKYGTAKLQRTFTFPGNEAQKLGGILADAAATPRVKEFLSGLVFTKEQKLTVFYDAEGTAMRVSYTGRCGADEKSQRKVTLNWSFKDDGDGARDTLTLKTPAVSGSDRDSVTWKRVLTVKGGKRSLTETLRHEAVRQKKKTVVEYEADLEHDLGKKSGEVKGEAWVKHTDHDGDTQTWIIAPKLTLALPEEAPQAAGTLTLTHKKGKRVSERATLDVSLALGDGFSWALSEETVDLDRLSDTDKEELIRGAGERMASQMLRSLLRLPGEELLFISEGLPPEAWQRILDTLGGM